MNVHERLARHNSNHSGFTGRSNDWELVHVEQHDNVTSARQSEKRIKGRGARRYLHDIDKE